MNNSATTLQQIRPQLPVRLFNGFGALLEKSRIPSTRMFATDLIETAKRRSGLDDFGEGDFFEALSRLLESCQDEARLNLIGKIALKTDVLETLCARLQMERDRQLYPDITRQEIREPLFIVGLPRSGTSVLHRLLGADPEHRSPLMWEVRSPSPPTRDDEKRRIQRATQSCNFFNWLVPTFRYVHTVGAEVPQECVSLMTPTFLSDQFDAMYYVPSYRAWFFRQDLRPAYEYHRRFLQHLQFRRAARRWILKAPTHMFAMPALLSVYPDALFVQTHRTPIDAMASVSSLVTILRSAFSDAVDPFIVCREAIDYWSETMDKFLRPNVIVWRGIASATFNMTRFVANPSAQFGGSTNISAGHCLGKRSNACACSLRARRRGNRRTTDMIYRSLVPRPRKCSVCSRHIASDLV